MRRWRRYINLVSFPLKILYAASVLLGLSGLLLNPNFQLLVGGHPSLNVAAELVKYIASSIILIIPIVFMMRTVHRRGEDPGVIIIGLIGYLTFHVSTMFLQTGSINPNVFRTSMGLMLDLSTLKTISLTLVNPLYTGFVGALLVSGVTRVAQNLSKNRTGVGVFGFIDSATAMVILTLMLSLLSGIAFAYVWPLVVNTMIGVFNFIARDLNNPVNLFLYGIVDRLADNAGLHLIIRRLFWFGELGGSWSDAFGVNFLGDVAVWTGQLKEGIINAGTGRLITPYYVLNLFAMPAYLFSTYQTFTDKLEKRKVFAFLTVAVVCSVLFGTLMPIELFLLFSAPLLFVFHLTMTGVLFAFFSAMRVSIGYSYTGNAIGAVPGSLFDLLIHIRTPGLQRPLLILLAVGLFTGLIYYAMSSYYYRKGAVNFITIDEKNSMVNELLNCIGGLENIKLINSSIRTLSVQVFDRSKVDFHKIRHHYISRIVESKAGYQLTYGAGSHILWLAIQHRLKELAYTERA
jgi:phosphotransferase system  glucose/maltose/N-acetylglucosamine-specific IIC component